MLQKTLQTIAIIAGSLFIIASNPSENFEDTSTKNDLVTIKSANIVSELNVSGNINDILITDSYAYLAVDKAKVVIVDIADIKNLKKVSEITVGAEQVDTLFYDDLFKTLYCSNHYPASINVSTPTNPVLNDLNKTKIRKTFGRNGETTEFGGNIIPLEAARVTKTMLGSNYYYVAGSQLSELSYIVNLFSASKTYTTPILNIYDKFLNKKSFNGKLASEAKGNLRDFVYEMTFGGSYVYYTTYREYHSRFTIRYIDISDPDATTQTSNTLLHEAGSTHYNNLYQFLIQAKTDVNDTSKHHYLYAVELNRNIYASPSILAFDIDNKVSTTMPSSFAVDVYDDNYTYYRESTNEGLIHLNAITESGDFLFIAGTSGLSDVLYIYDISSRMAPKFLLKKALRSGISSLRVKNQYVFVGGASLVVLDLSPAEPKVEETATILPEYAPEIRLSEDTFITFDKNTTLSGAQSFDKNGDILSYTWSIVSQPAGNPYTLPQDINDSFTFVPPAVEGNYTFNLVISDGNLTDEGNVTVNVVSPVPVAVSRSSSTGSVVYTNETVTLDANQSIDPTDDALTYIWELTAQPIGSTYVIPDTALKTFSFTPTVGGTYTFSLTVNDGTYTSVASVINVDVTTPNTIPVAVAGNDQNVTVNTPVVLDGNSSYDADNNPLTYTWSFVSKPASSVATLVDANKSIAGFIPDVNGTYTLSLVVNDGITDSTLSLVSINAYILPNAIPVANAGADQNATIGTVVTLEGNQSYDEENDTIIYAWSLVSKPVLSALTIDFTPDFNSSFAFIPDTNGSYVMSLRVTDFNHSTTFTEDNITIFVEANASAEVNATTGFATSVGEVNTTQVTTSIAVSSGYTYLVNPTGLYIYDANVSLVGSYTAFAGTPQAVAVDGTTAYVVDDNGTDLHLYALNALNPAAITEISNLTITGASPVLTINGSYLYIGSQNATIQVINIATPSAMVSENNITTTDAVLDLDSNNSVLIASTYLGFDAIDITTPSTATVTGSYTSNATFIFNGQAAIHGDLVYFNSQESVTEIVDISNIAAPTHVADSNASFGGQLNAVATSPKYAFIYEYSSDNNESIAVFDITTPTTPVHVTNLETLGTFVNAMIVDGNFLHIGTNTGLQVLDISGN